MKNVIDYLGVFFRAVIVVLLFVLIQLSVGWAFIIAGVDNGVYHGLFSMVYGFAAAAAFIAYHLVRSYKRDKLIKFTAPGAFNSVAAVVIGFGLLGLVTLYMVAAGLISQFFAPVADELTEYSEHINRYSEVEAVTVPYWDSVLEFFAAVLVVPLVEELAFRGALFGEFNCKFNAVVSAVLSAVVFGLLHGVSVHIGYAIICGILLALIYYYSGSIWVSYIVHAVFNLIGNAIFTLLKSGMFGDMSAAVEQASMHTAVIEIFCILPASAAFVLVYRRYKVRNDNKTPDVNTVEAGAVI